MDSLSLSSNGSVSKHVKISVSIFNKADSVEKILIIEKTEGKKRRKQQRMRWLDRISSSLTRWTWIWANSRGQWRTEKPGVLQSMRLQRFRHDLVTEHNNNKTLIVATHRQSSLLSSISMKSTNGFRDQQKSTLGQD